MRFGTASGALSGAAGICSACGKPGHDAASCPEFAHLGLGGARADAQPLSTEEVQQLLSCATHDATPRVGARVLMQKDNKCWFHALCAELGRPLGACAYIHAFG